VGGARRTRDGRRLAGGRARRGAIAHLSRRQGDAEVVLVVELRGVSPAHLAHHLGGGVETCAARVKEGAPRAARDDAPKSASRRTLVRLGVRIARIERPMKRDV